MTSEQAINLLCALTGDHPANVRKPEFIGSGNCAWSSDSQDLELWVSKQGVVTLEYFGDDGFQLTGPVGAALARAFLSATNPKCEEV